MISGLLLLTSFLSQECQEVSAFSLSRRASSPASCSIPIKTSKLFTNVDDDDFFDPFLHSPHDYPDGVDNGPEGGSVAAPNGLGAIDEIFESNSSSFGFSSISSSSEPSVSPNTGKINSNDTGDLFDPLLSPHAYPDGISAGPVTATTSQIPMKIQSTKKLAILLIDHGSKREASNQHLQFVAETYEASIIQRDATSNGESSSATSGRETVVRAAHMEIAEPSILTSLVRACVCVLYCCRRCMFAVSFLLFISL